MSSSNRYYRPYLSDKEESDSESETESQFSSESESSQSSGGIGSPLALARAGGPSMFKLTNKIDPRIQPQLKNGVQYSLYDMSGVSDLPFTGTSFDVETGNQTSILIVNSRDRDRSIYLQPSLFTLRVPRIYKNITSFQILQLKLLSAFFYFRPDKENTKLQILENGRTLLNSSNQVVPNTITTTIRTGTYDISTLLSELQTQLNRTPLFFFFPNGISDFILLFAPSGDLGLGFNQPGDTFFDTLRSKFITNPTIAIIVSYYFNSQYAGLSSYTIQQVKYAYYYPVLYECYLDTSFGPTSLNLKLVTSTLPSGETMDQRILYTKQGLNDTVIAELINNNITVLDSYRNLHTFKYSLVNGYVCSYESFNNRINISSSNLNTSLVNLINLQTTKALAAELNARSMTVADYNNLVTSVSLNTAVFTNMYNMLQNRFAIYFGIDFNTYAPEFFADLSSSLFIQNAVGATGIDTGYSLSVLQKGNVPITSSTSNLRDTPVYWPKLKNLVGGSIEYPYNLTDNSSVPYNVETQTFLNQQFVDNSGFIYTDLVNKAGDIVIPIQPSKYTVFRFKSLVRQNLQVETLPIPYYRRYPDYNATLGGNVAGYFDMSYSYNYKTYNSNMDNITQNSINLIPVTYGQSSNTSVATATSYALQIQTSVYYYQLKTPVPTNPINDVSGYTYIMNVTALASPQATFITPVSMFLYHDRGAFMADVSGVRNEIAYHYKKKTSALSTDSSMTINFRAYSKQTYYVILRSDLLSFQNTSFKIFTWFPTDPVLQDISYNLVGFDPYANPLSNLTNSLYAHVNDSNFIQLPTDSNLMGLDPSSDAFNSNIPIPEALIGYDISGVSIDLTDYKGYLQTNPRSNVPFATFRKDPLTNFSFQQLSLYDSNSQTYFYSGSSNVILTPYTNTSYTRKEVEARQYKIVHWYDYNYIPQQNGEVNPSSNVADMTAFTSNITNLSGYTYGTSNFIQLGNGVIGFTFLPQAGVWDISSMFFKSAWNQQTVDINGAITYTDCSNDAIKYLGIFKTSLLTNVVLTSIDIKSAIQVLEFDSKIKYTEAQVVLNNGFETRGGTYYNFKATKSNTIPLTNSNQLLAGFTPGSNDLVPDTSLYSIIAFNTSCNITNIYLLAGSLVPYPDVTTATAVTQYFGCNSPTEQGMVLPVYTAGYDTKYAPSNGNIYSSQYEQSMSIGTQVLHYNNNANITQDSNGLYSFNLTPFVASPSIQFADLKLLAVTPLYIYASASYYNPGTATTSNVYGMYLTTGNGRAFVPFYSRTAVTSNQASNMEIDGSNYYYGGGGGSNNPSDSTTDSINSVTSSNFDIGTYLDRYVPTSFFCTAFNSNDYNDDLLQSNITIFKDYTIVLEDYFYRFFLDRVNYITLNNSDFLGRIGYNALTYTLTDPSSHITSNSSLAVVMVKSRLYRQYAYGGALEPDSNLTYPDPVTIFYKTPTSAMKQMSVRGSNGNYYIGNSLNNVISNAGGISVSMESSHTNTKMYILPYDQYEYDVQTNSGSNLYCVDLSGEPNSNTSLIGFTKGTIVYQFTGVPNTFATVHAYSSNVILLKTAENDALYYISSSNLITSNANYRVYRTTVSLTKNILDLPTGKIGTLLTGPNKTIFLGVTKYNFPGNDNTIPRYTIYTSGRSYYIYDSSILAWKWALAPVYPNGITVTDNFICYGDGTLYVEPNGYNIRITNLVDAPLLLLTGGPQTSYVAWNSGDAFGQLIYPDTYTAPTEYCIYRTGRAYYTLYFNTGQVQWNPGVTVTGYFYCDISGNLYTETSSGLGYNVLIASPTDFSPYTVVKQIRNVSYYNYPTYTNNIYNPASPTPLITIDISGVISSQSSQNIKPVPFDLMYLYGNRGDQNRDPILTKIVGSAWQIFYPNFKLNMVKKSNSTSPITNTTDLTTYPYYPHTSMFFYSSFDKMVSDISGLWAQEKAKNFLASDVSSGYFFMSYINTINLAKSTNFTNGNSSYNYLAIRGYSPTEKFQCLLRFYLPGRYDFGYMSIYNLMEESEQIVLKDLSGTSLVNPAYNKALNLFNIAFKITSNFGANSVPGFGGSNLTFSGFSNFMTQYKDIYTIGSSNAALLNSITSNVRSNVRSYISQYLGDILPPYVLQRDIFTASLTFSILFKSSLSPAYLAIADEWGLGYNLGFDKVDTEYSTVQRATSFFKILDDYIYLRLNPEFTMNRMDTTALENLSVTHEPTGVVNQYAAKLLLAPFGNYATTLIQNPIQFNPVLQSLDRLSFQWTDTAGTTLNNTECEWNAVVQIQERITAPKVGSTIPRPNK